MRKYQFAIIFILAALSFFACKKKTDQILSPSQLAIGDYITVDKANNTEFNYANISTSAVSWNVRTVGENSAKIISFASTNNTTNKATWKKIKETTLTDNKATISVTGGELASALGIQATSLKPGNTYIIFNQVVTASGKTYDIVNTNAEFESAAAFNMGFRLNAIITCPFNPVGFAGDFAVVSDDQWQDFSAGDVLQVTAATDSTITLLEYPSPAYGTNRQPIIVKINKTNGRATIEKQYVGDYGSTKASVQTTAGVTSYVFSCSGDIILYQDIFYGSSVYGKLLLRLKKI